MVTVKLRSFTAFIKLTLVFVEIYSLFVLELEIQFAVAVSEWIEPFKSRVTSLPNV